MYVVGLAHIPAEALVGLVPDGPPSAEGEAKARAMHRPKIRQHLLANAPPLVSKPLTRRRVIAPGRQPHLMSILRLDIEQWQLRLTPQGVPLRQRGEDLARVHDPAPWFCFGYEIGAVGEIASNAIAFARSGEPNNLAVPHWPAYQPSGRSTMVFDVQSKVIDDFRGDERKLLSALAEKSAG
jgi:hypothetical protein